MSSLQSAEKRYITDAWQQAQKSYPLKSPIDGTVIAEVADCGPQEAIEAAAAGWRAFEGWKGTTAFERSEILMAWHDLITGHAEELAKTMTLEMGKPIKEARTEISYAAGFVKWYAEEAKRVYGDVFPSHLPQKRLMAIKQPVGPVFAITPWNFPAAMVTRKAGPALAAGCSFILKPAEQTPLSALYLADLWRQAGGPEGTLQVLPTRDPVPLSDTLLADPQIRKLTFTGSTEVGRLLYKKASETVKKISLELGGHAPFLIFDDADLDLAVREVVACKYRNAGQTCVCTNRIYVHSSVLEAFTDRYIRATEALRVGDPLRDDTDIGPLVDEQGLTKVQQHIQDAVAKGASLKTGGRSLEGLYFEPTVLTDITSEMKIMQEETFGPVAPIIAFDDEAEVIGKANDTQYGLAAYLYTNDLSRAFRVSEALEYGIVGVNDGVPAVPYAPFGGVKQSGLGREGGPWGIEEYLEIKYLSMTMPR
ncbi:MAG: NAD-dependent succinate-semialdehyde dehydrogenase [Trueperaceae bacterium]|nr:MAG: NAD-dependent succinate-semialdehyde dehydrogenase [Trueperaceae bacterium]